MELPEDLQGRALTRRQLMSYLGVVGAGAFVSESAAAWVAGPSWARLIERAAHTKPHGSDLGAIEHIVFLMMENRSYDHYFGAYPKGAGSTITPSTRSACSRRTTPAASSLFPKNKLLPFHLDSMAGFECTDDLTHDWGPMHLCWNGGKMDSWVKVHTSPSTRAPTVR